MRLRRPVKESERSSFCGQELALTDTEFGLGATFIGDMNEEKWHVVSTELLTFVTSSSCR